MKRAAAFILSLTLLWLQVAASAQTSASAATPAPCGCCSTKKACCCLEQSTPEALPLPVAPAPSSAALDFTIVISKQLAWTLPAIAPAIVSSPDPSASTLAVPLFTRDCALLI